MRKHPADLVNNLERLTAILMRGGTKRRPVALVFADGDVITMTNKQFYSWLRGNAA